MTLEPLMSVIKVIQLDETRTRYETAKALSEYVNVSLSFLLVIINQAAAALNNPVPTPEMVLGYMHSVPYLSVYINPEKSLTAQNN